MPRASGPKAWLDLLVNHGEHLDTLESLVVEKRLDVLEGRHRGLSPVRQGWNMPCVYRSTCPTPTLNG